MTNARARRRVFATIACTPPLPRAIQHLVLLCLSLLCFQLPRAQAEDKWIKVKSAHFEMFTSSNDRQAKDAIAHFEQARSFFLEASGSKSVPASLVHIVAFRGPKSYQPYQLNSGAAAFYLATESQDFIVMQDLERDNFPIAVHEYTHLIVQHTGMTLPIWLNEGLADVYSTLEPQGNYVLVGRPLAGRVYQLTQTKWLDLPALFAVDRSSPYYNEREKMSIFYSESWLLTDMLVRSRDYSGKFNQFLGNLVAGHPSAEALRLVYGKDLPQIVADMKQYFNTNMLGPTTRVSKFSIKLEKLAEDPEVTPAPDLELRLALADVLIGERRVEQAASQLVALSKEYPQSPQVEEVWADMAWRELKYPEAATHCRKAFALGSQNAKSLAQCAAVEASQGVPPNEVIPALERAVTLDPNNKQARMNLAFQLLNQQKFGAALSQLSEVHSLKPEEATRYYTALGYAKLKLGSGEAARQDLERAKQYAKSPGEATQAQLLLDEMDRAAIVKSAGESSASSLREPPAPRTSIPRSSSVDDDNDDSNARPTLRRPRPDPPEDPSRSESYTPLERRLPHVSGVLSRIDCVGQTWQMHVATTEGDRVLVVTGPHDILIHDTANEGSLTFGCGEKLNKRVIVYYDPAVAVGPKAMGAAKVLDFVSKQ